MSMPQRDPAMLGQLSYERREGDCYWTESWVTEALLDSFPLKEPFWEPACGRGDIVQVLRKRAWLVYASDIEAHGCQDSEIVDFLSQSKCWPFAPQTAATIITNPPYKQAEAFIRRALEWAGDYHATIAMLLRHEFDCAAQRADLFDRPDYAAKVTLRRRPRWDWWERDKPKASPRHNFAWFVWTSTHVGPPAQLYWPMTTQHRQDVSDADQT